MFLRMLNLYVQITCLRKSVCASSYVWGFWVVASCESFELSAWIGLKNLLNTTDANIDG